MSACNNYGTLLFGNQVWWCASVNELDTWGPILTACTVSSAASTDRRSLLPSRRSVAFQVYLSNVWYMACRSSVVWCNHQLWHCASSPTPRRSVDVQADSVPIPNGRSGLVIVLADVREIFVEPVEIFDHGWTVIIDRWTSRSPRRRSREEPRPVLRTNRRVDRRW